MPAFSPEKSYPERVQTLTPAWMLARAKACSAIFFVSFALLLRAIALPFLALLTYKTWPP